MTPEEIAAAIAAAGAQDPNAPIGVPAGYVPPIHSTSGFSPGAGPAIAPSDLRDAPYKPGDDLRPASLAPEQIVTIQQHLVDAGLLRGTFQAGVWDDTTRVAYRGLLGYANQLGTTDEFALRRWQATGMGQVDPTPAERAPLVVEVSNPADIEREFRDYLRDKTGTGKLDDAQIHSVVAKVQGEQKMAAQAKYDAGADPDGATVTAAPALETVAEGEAKRINPVGFRAHEYLDALSTVSSMLGGEA